MTCEQRIQALFLEGYTVNAIVNKLLWEMPYQDKSQRQKVRHIVESALMKIKWEDK